MHSNIDVAAGTQRDPSEPGLGDGFVGGRPVFRCPELSRSEQVARAVRELAWNPRDCSAQRWRDSIEAGEEPTFTVQEIGALGYSLASARGIEIDRFGCPPTGDVLLAGFLKPDAKTYLWSAGLRAFAIGPDVERARAILGGSDSLHRLDEPVSFAS